MSEVNEERYLYTVYPKKPIRNLTENIPILRVSKSLYLTKEEVLKCFECGSVYRRFSNDGIVEKFNKYEIDRVHRAHYISREDWVKMTNEEEQGGESPAETLTVNGAASVEEPQEIKEEKIEEVAVTVEEEPVTVSNCINQDQPLVIEAPEPTAENIVDINTISIKNDPIEIEITTEDISTEEEVPVEEVVEDEEQVEDEITEEETVEFENVEEANTQNRPAVSLNYNGKKKKHH